MRVVRFFVIRTSISEAWLILVLISFVHMYEALLSVVLIFEFKPGPVLTEDLFCSNVARGNTSSSPSTMKMSASGTFIFKAAIYKSIIFYFLIINNIKRELRGIHIS